MSRSSILSRFTQDKSGGVTIWNATCLLGILAVGGFAIDSSNAWRVKTLLQNTAEASALAAALFIDDPDKAKTTAVEFAQRNMPSSVHGMVITEEDVAIGVFDKDTNTFVVTNENPDAVMVNAGRNLARQNAVATYLLRFAGVEEWEVGRHAIAYPRWGAGSEEQCQGATVIASGLLNTGSGNTLIDGVCIHGQLGVITGGGDYFDETVQITAWNIIEIILGYLRYGSKSPAISQESKDLTLLPTLQNRFGTLWAELYASGIENYSGSALPDYLLGNDGQADVVQIDTAEWVVGPDMLAPHTIYMVNGSVRFDGDVDASNTAIIAQGNIDGGEGSLSFEDVVFFADGSMVFPGNAAWGDPANYCDGGAYNTYLFSNSFLSLGAGAGPNSTHGVVAAAPWFSAGNAMADIGGFYLETSAWYANLGGNIEITHACDEQLQSHYEITQFANKPTIIGSTLRR